MSNKPHKPETLEKKKKNVKLHNPETLEETFLNKLNKRETLEEKMSNKYICECVALHHEKTLFN